jgi:hypothetical protein
LISELALGKMQNKMKVNNGVTGVVPATKIFSQILTGAQGKHVPARIISGLVMVNCESDYHLVVDESKLYSRHEWKCQPGNQAWNVHGASGLLRAAVTMLRLRLKMLADDHHVETLFATFVL